MKILQVIGNFEKNENKKLKNNEKKKKIFMLIYPYFID
jgi:hypothetical protein